MEAEIQSPIDLTSRTPTHIRFAESEHSQLVEHQRASRSIRNFESQSSQRTAMSDMAQEISRLRSEVSEMRRISPVGEILNHQSDGETALRMDSSGPIAQEESLVTAPVDLSLQQIVEASPTINSVDIRNAPSTVTMDRRDLYPSIAISRRQAQRLRKRLAYRIKTRHSTTWRC